jgi:hypothetical protein
MLADESVETLFSCALEIFVRGEFAADVASLFEQECVHQGLDPELRAAAFAKQLDADRTHEFFRAWVEANASQSVR